MAISDFIEGVFLPEVKAARRPSTYKNYRDIYRLHVKPRLSLGFFQKKGDFRCCDGERLLGSVARQARTKDGKPLGRNTLARIKSFLSGAFKTAKRVIVPRIEKCKTCRKSKAEHRPEAHLFELDRSLYWKGWHAFRRGLATTLHQLGTPDRKIQAILRHSNIAITQASYIKSVAESQQNALDLVAAEMAADESCNNRATEDEGPVN